ncbi:hypothetical protein BC940DRAFT_307821 [Gongronella butleri]|nr:hypothetical protein BC940DRAFT_307821 [Gongronella butleri]
MSQTRALSFDCVVTLDPNTSRSFFFRISKIGDIPLLLGNGLWAVDLSSGLPVAMFQLSIARSAC